MFLAILPISKTGGSAADILAIVHFLYHKLFFQHGVLLLATCLPEPECFQAICRTNQMLCSSFYDSNLGKQNDLTTCWYQQYRVFQQEKCLSYAPDCVGWVTETPNCLCGEGAAPCSNHNKWGDTPFKIPRTLYLGQSSS